MDEDKFVDAPSVAAWGNIESPPGPDSGFSEMVGRSSAIRNSQEVWFLMESEDVPQLLHDFSVA